MKALFETRSLTKAFGGKTALSDVTVACQPGQIVGLLGPNGSGKTTLLRLASGLAAHFAGRRPLTAFDWHNSALFLALGFALVPPLSFAMDCLRTHAGRDGTQPSQTVGRILVQLLPMTLLFAVGNSAFSDLQRSGDGYAAYLLVETVSLVLVAAISYLLLAKRCQKRLQTIDL